MSSTTNAYVVITSLTAEQRTVLQAIYDYFREHAAWPKFIGIETCDGGSEDTARFAQLLRWLAEREESYEPEPGVDEEMPLVTSQEASEYLRLAGDNDRLLLLRLFAMLQLDHWGLGSAGSNGDNWQIRLGQDIWRFGNVQNVQDMNDAREGWIAEGRRALGGTNGDAQQPVYYALAAVPFVQPSLPPAPLYVDQQVIDAIRVKDSKSALSVTKLLKLIDELNDNYARGNTYASHALLRGLLDHIPPIFGQPHFDAVASNCRWPKTDKNYMKRLANDAPPRSRC